MMSPEQKDAGKGDPSPIPLMYLTEEHRNTIACHLDLESKWKIVAESAGLKTRQITWIAIRNAPKGSPTLLMLTDLEEKNVPLDRFIEAVNSSNTMPAMDYLRKIRAEIEETFQRDRRNLQALKFDNSVPEGIPDAYQKCTKNIHVLIVHDPLDSMVVMNLARCLCNNEIGVILGQEWDCPARLAEFSDKANFTLLVASPNFLKDIRDNSGQATWSERVARLTKKMAIEKKSNRRERLLITTVNEASESDVPEWMRPAETFKWQRDSKNLVFRISKGIIPTGLVRPHFYTSVGGSGNIREGRHGSIGDHSRCCSPPEDAAVQVARRLRCSCLSLGGSKV